MDSGLDLKKRSYRLMQRRQFATRKLHANKMNSFGEHRAKLSTAVVMLELVRWQRGDHVIAVLEQLPYQ
jgi:hypothetical protein